MKALLAILLSIITSANADLIAHLETDKGTVDIVLQHDSAPQAVANFMTLAMGTRSRIDPLTGIVTNNPLYIGEKFFRTANSSSFKFAQTGSGSGTNSGGSGFTFKDEFTPSVRHTGYTLSSANSGPNTNNGQVFITGNVTIAQYDDLHSIIGLIPSTASRLVVDAIIASGDNGSTITNVTFSRTDPAAIAFDELAQGLPSVSPVTGDFRVETGPAPYFDHASPMPLNRFLAVRRSTNLATWSSLPNIFSGYDNSPLISSRSDRSSLTKAFFRFAQVDCPNSDTPGSLANRTLTFTIPNSADTISFSFDGTGYDGTATYSFNGSVGTLDYVSYDPAGYGASLIVDSTNLVGLLINLAIDETTASQHSGRMTLSSWTGFSWSSIGATTYTLTK